MSIASEITRLESAKNTLKTKLNAKNDQEHQITDETIDEYGDFIDTISTGKLTNEEYNEADEDVDDILENTVVPSGTISITENGEYDVTNYTDANVNVSGNILPSTYQQVEYIQTDSTNPQYTFLCTGIQIKGISTIDVKYSFSNVVTNNPMVFASYVSEESLGSAAPFICATGNVSGSWEITPTITKSTTNTAKNFLIVNSDTSTNYLKIGGWGDANWTAIGRYYYVRIFDKSNAIIFNGVPCYRKSDNEVGMYDLISRTFFTNASTGTYTAGNEV